MSDVKSTNRFALFFFLFFIFVGEILNIFPWLRNFSYTTLSAIVTLFAFGVTILTYFIVTKKDIKTTLKLNKLSGRNAFFAVLFAYAMQPMMNFLAVILSLFFPNLVEESLQMSQGSSFFALLFTMAVLPAFLEEIVLRGIFLSGYKDLGSFRAVIYTALLFGLLHMNPQQVPYAVFAGLVFCFLVERMGSIWASVIPHFLINGSSVVLSHFVPIEETGASLDMFSTGELLFYTGGYALFSLPWLFFLMYLVCRFNPIKKQNNFPNYQYPQQYPQQYPKHYPQYIPEPIIHEENPTYFPIEKVKFFTWEIWVVLGIFIVFGVLPYMDYFFQVIGK